MGRRYSLEALTVAFGLDRLTQRCSRKTGSKALRLSLGLAQPSRLFLSCTAFDLNSHQASSGAITVNRASFASDASRWNSSNTSAWLPTPPSVFLPIASVLAQPSPLKERLPRSAKSSMTSTRRSPPTTPARIKLPPDPLPRLLPGLDISVG
jgi:hypothetical protein